LRLRRDAADPITDRSSLAPINYRAAAAHLAACCIRNIVFRASLNLDSVFADTAAICNARYQRVFRSYQIRFYIRNIRFAIVL